jgi:hypothetical protein
MSTDTAELEPLLTDILDLARLVAVKTRTDSPEDMPVIAIFDREPVQTLRCLVANIRHGVASL